MYEIIRGTRVLKRSFDTLEKAEAFVNKRTAYMIRWFEKDGNLIPPIASAADETTDRCRHLHFNTLKQKNLCNFFVTMVTNCFPKKKMTHTVALLDSLVKLHKNDANIQKSFVQNDENQKTD